MAADTSEPPPLRRNRDFALLQAGQLLSAAGTQSSAVVYPLLVLALGHSPATAGVVTFARIAPLALFGLLGGVAADRFDRRALMLAADAVRAVAAVALVCAVALDRLAVWQLVAIAFVEGSCAAVFNPAAAGALRSVVPLAQLPAAAGAQQARTAAVNLAGPPLGGALLGLGRAVPFAADALSYLCSIVSLLLIRTPFQHPRELDRAPLRARVSDGFGFLWKQPFLRTTAFLYGLTNFIGPGLLLVVVVLGQREGLSSAAVGALLAAFAAFMLLGSLASPLLRRALSTRAILLLELWAWLGPALFLLWPNVWVLTASMLAAAVAIPVTDSVVIAHRLAITPDRLVGRVEAVRSTIALLIAPLGPLVAGAVLAAASARAAVAVFVAAAVALALWGTLSPALGQAPSLAAARPD